MAKSLNFNTLKKTYFTITLNDKKKTTLILGTPKKTLMDEMMALDDVLEELQKSGDNRAVTDELYCTCAHVMSCNKGGIKVTKEFLEDIFDIEDIITFFRAYTDFLGEITSSKN